MRGDYKKGSVKSGVLGRWGFPGFRFGVQGFRSRGLSGFRVQGCWGKGFRAQSLGV